MLVDEYIGNCRIRVTERIGGHEVKRWTRVYHEPEIVTVTNMEGKEKVRYHRCSICGCLLYQEPE